MPRATEPNSLAVIRMGTTSRRELVPAGSTVKLQIQVSETLAILHTLTRVAQRLDHV
ncbi:hypothetical protein EV644_12926 [Kribbella orskensis]|uniref:Uncharacterized protein n=1 Tax=Kribbella orskensis TaxID=2512216 RepID=A0ABY2BBA7_9ACTN|nr:hypothetical protein EV642_13126 [Kribbella sp. VKM Ac-2500]TCO11658.1 hypothetical protein EV644_12926 [Kribbella orskensis]